MQSDSSRTILVTGGAGFIGSNLVLGLLASRPGDRIVNLDALTYAGNLDGLPTENTDHYEFVRCDLRDADATRAAVEKYQPDVAIHLAAESHVDRSIHGPKVFVETNVLGTLNLLEACRAVWGPLSDKRFHHVSTDEVYGSLGETGLFREDTPYDPSSPYSASKAGSDHLARAYSRTFGMNVTVTNCSNNYGPRQFPEKLIPVMLMNALEGKPLPVYGDGKNVRDWLHVGDHCDAIMTVVDKGLPGETYNVGGNAERTNLDVIAAILDAVASETGKDRAALNELITYVKDRPGHDRRYAIDATKIRRELGWGPKRTFEEGIVDTVRWFLANSEWVERVRSGAYREWIEANYGERLA